MFQLGNVKSEFESDHTLLSKNDIRPRIIYETIALLPLMKLNFYQVYYGRT